MRIWDDGDGSNNQHNHNDTIQVAIQMRMRHQTALLDELMKPVAPEAMRPPMGLEKVISSGLRLICDLFSGCGGCADAATQNGAHVACFAEIDSAPRAMYVKSKFARANLLIGDQGDVKTIKLEEIPAVVMTTAGFPCTKVSKVGNTEGFYDTEVGRLVFEVIYIAQGTNVPCLLLENVANLINVRYEGVSCLRLICLAFSRIGYHTVVHDINALWAGVAQRRQRLYIAVFRERQWKERYLQLLDDKKSPLRRALRNFQVGINTVIEKGIDKVSNHDLFLPPKQIKKKNSKFWAVAVSGSKLTTTWGNAGTDGRSQTKDLGNAESALKQAEKLVSEYMRKGYSLESSKKQASAFSRRYVCVTKSSWQQNKMHVLCVDSAQPARCMTASYARSGYDVTYICRKTKKQLDLGADHSGKLEYDDYKDIGVWRMSDKEQHDVMGFSRITAWVNSYKDARSKALGNAVVPKVVAPIMATMFEALGFERKIFEVDTRPSQLVHHIRTTNGVEVHTFQHEPK